VQDFLEQYVWLPPKNWKSIAHSAAVPATIVCLVLGLIFICWTFLLESAKYRSGSDYVIIVVFLVLAGLFWLVKRFLGVSMDYTYNGGDFTVDKILDDSKRKKVISFTMSQVELLAPVSHENYSKYQADTSVKQVAGYLDPQAKLYFAVVKDETGRTVVTFQPNASMLELMKSANPQAVQL